MKNRENKKGDGKDEGQNRENITQGKDKKEKGRKEKGSKEERVKMRRDQQEEGDHNEKESAK